MSDIKYLNGPWKWKFDAVDEVCFVYDDNSGYDIALVELRNNENGSSDNINMKLSRLIAASPEMRDALIEADKIICSLCKRLNPHHKECNYCDDRESRIKIIEKATGLTIEEVLS